MAEYEVQGTVHIVDHFTRTFIAPDDVCARRDAIHWAQDQWQDQNVDRVSIVEIREAKHKRYERVYRADSDGSDAVRCIGVDEWNAASTIQRLAWMQAGYVMRLDEMILR